MLYYTIAPGAKITTNAVADTANDCLFVKPGTRTCWVKSIYPQGRGANLTNISGINYRLEEWTATASSGGSALTPVPDDDGYQAAKQTAGFSASAVVSGTGGPLLKLAIGSGTTSPGNWVAPSLDEAYPVEGSANKSLDLFNIASAVSLSFEPSIGTVE